VNKSTVLYFLLLVTTPAWAGVESQYVGQENRDIKSLSPQEMSDYLEGKGMGYAKSAELNKYPGPRHVLDMASELGLTQEQIENPPI